MTGELYWIRGGERPPDHEIRQEWDAFIREARSRWQTLREQLDRMRGKPPTGDDGLDEPRDPPAD